MAITPRHFLDLILHFILHFFRLYKEKRSGPEEEQLHINVKEVQKSLAVKSQELETKNNEAKEKLKQMVKDQQEAEEQ